MTTPVLGSMIFGTRVDEATSFAILDRFVERGGVWIDTADCYAWWIDASGWGGQSEALIGRWLAARPGVRERIRISTKGGADRVGGTMMEPVNSGLAPEVLRRSAAASLERLGVEQIDLYWLHAPDTANAIEPAVDVLSELRDAGRIVRGGASNFASWELERGRGHARATGGLVIDAIQLQASYLRVRPGALLQGNTHRFGRLSEEQLDHATREHLEIWAYTPLLRGQYDDPAKPLDPALEHPGTTRKLAVLAEVAAELGVTRSEVVLAWLLAQETPILPIAGVSSIAQLDAAFDGCALELPAELLARLNGVAA